MRLKTVAILFCAVLFFIGCAQVQQPKTQPVSSQYQLQSASHWQTIAKQEGEYIYKAITDPKYKLVDEDGGSPAIYISEADKSAFGVAMRKYLITELMSDEFKKTHPVEINISSKSDAPIVVSWETQLVNRAPWRPKPFYGVPAFIADLVGIILVGGGWHTSDVGVPHTELILTTMIDLRELKMARHSNTYFINDEDQGNYWQNPAAYAASSAYSKSIRAKDDAMRAKFAESGQLAQ
ncbi:MAG: hypothetical protein GX625_08285 [Clostridiaceae bacterium]|nr:hypothetical protein [Clostridiaceae bacterium]